MYKSFSAADYKRFQNLESDYRVDGVLAYGGWKKDVYRQILEQTLRKVASDVVYETLTGFLEEVVVFVVDGRRYWFETFYGSARMSEVLHMACLFGARKNILLGSCGGLMPGLEESDSIVPTWSYGEESSAKLYEREAVDNKFLADEKLSRDLMAMMDPAFDVYRGPIVTCQAMLGETWEDVQNWSEQGYFGVDMESATFFAVSKHFGVPAAAVLSVADNLIKEQTVMDESYVARKELREQIRLQHFELAIRELLK